MPPESKHTCRFGPQQGQSGTCQRVDARLSFVHTHCKTPIKTGHYDKKMKKIARPALFALAGVIEYDYHMDGVSKTYPGGKKCFENIRLSFLPGVKIGVVGVNGSGKSTLLRIMAGIDKDFTGEAWAAKGARVGYLAQEPELDASLDVRGNVMLGVAAKQAKLDRYNDLAMNYSDDTADEMAALQDEIDAENLWDLDSQIDVAMEALRCPPDAAHP